MVAKWKKRGIATWAIRISGLALQPKRPVRDSDLLHFRLLLNSGYNQDDVIRAVQRHPQMPHNIIGEDAIDMALNILAERHY